MKVGPSCVSVRVSVLSERASYMATCNDAKGKQTKSLYYTYIYIYIRAHNIIMASGGGAWMAFALLYSSSMVLYSLYGLAHVYII